MSRMVKTLRMLVISFVFLVFFFFFLSFSFCFNEGSQSNEQIKMEGKSMTNGNHNGIGIIKFYYQLSLATNTYYVLQFFGKLVHQARTEAQTLYSYAIFFLFIILHSEIECERGESMSVMHEA